jgi:hypothetical protein
MQFVLLPKYEYWQSIYRTIFLCVVLFLATFPMIKGHINNDVWQLKSLTRTKHVPDSKDRRCKVWLETKRLSTQY